MAKTELVNSSTVDTGLQNLSRFYDARLYEMEDRFIQVKSMTIVLTRSLSLMAGVPGLGQGCLEREVESSESVAVSSLGTIIHWHTRCGVALDSCG